MDHDRPFKQLLTVFFFEFIQRFLPGVAQYIDPTFVEFMDKESFAGIPRRRGRKESDLVAKVRFKDNTEAFFLILVENESSPSQDLPQRLFYYHVRLSEKYGLPVYPVVIFSYSTPTRQEPTVYQQRFPDKIVLQFHYTVIQLNRLPWRSFVKQPNPAATALMTRMKMSKSDRPRVKAECLRLLITLKLDPGKSDLIGEFMETYLDLSNQESQVYERAIAEFEPQIREEAMEFGTSWRRLGRAEGREEGREEGRAEGERKALIMIGTRRLGEPLDAVRAAIDGITSVQRIEELMSRLLEVESWDELLSR
jgi:hypothetical protein